MENDKITMTEDEIIKDYPRLKLEYTRLHEDYRRLKSKQLNIANVSRCAFYVEIEAVGSIIVIAENKEEVYVKIKKEGITSPCIIKVAMSFIA